MTWDGHSNTRSVPARLQRACFKRDHYTCQGCGYRGTRGDGTLHADHVHNRATGGADDLDNLVTLCQPCHARKTARERAAGIAARHARRHRPTPPHPGLKPQGGV
ncbi:HNH endonuclease [Gordonia sp. (in: high G+C Gram-positive bacteria)]|uniref:HNH endonuclease n=1 Tax=Gordonia sp. (in: high G+C Gram-positive bacteria) TaxID=84139 RepID=UPI0039E2559D